MYDHLVVEANSHENKSAGLEFGYELVMVVPYVYYHHKKGKTVQVKTCRDMSPFYYFLPDNQIIEEYNTRACGLPSGTKLKELHIKNPSREEWLYPPYKEKYKEYELKTKFNKPIVMVGNKYTEEWGGNPINYLSIDCLDKLFNILSRKYDIIYNRPKSKNITCDMQETREIDDRFIVDKYKNVYDLNEILEKEDYDFNTLQLILLSKCENKISVQGGGSILYSLTGGNNIVYAVFGGELNCNAYRGWYGDFSKCNVRDFNNYNELIKEVEGAYL